MDLHCDDLTRWATLNVKSDRELSPQWKNSLFSREIITTTKKIHNWTIVGGSDQTLSSLSRSEILFPFRTRAWDIDFKGVRFTTTGGLPAKIFLVRWKFFAHELSLVVLVAAEVNDSEVWDSRLETSRDFRAGSVWGKKIWKSKVKTGSNVFFSKFFILNIKKYKFFGFAIT